MGTPAKKIAERPAETIQIVAEPNHPSTTEVIPEPVHTEAGPAEPEIPLHILGAEVPEEFAAAPDILPEPDADITETNLHEPADSFEAPFVLTELTAEQAEKAVEPYEELIAYIFDIDKAIPAAEQVSTEEPLSVEIYAGEQPPDLLHEIYTQLAEQPAEVKLSLVSGFREIAEIVRFLQETSPENDTEPVAEAVTARLAELCRTVLETIDFDYEDEDIERFVALLLELDRSERTLPAEETDLREDVGTHERKYFRQPGWDLGKIRIPLHRIIGMTALSSRPFTAFLSAPQ